MRPFQTNWPIKSSCLSFLCFRLLLCINKIIHHVWILFFHNKIISMCLFGSLNHLLICSFHIIFDILSEGCVEKYWLLTHNAKLRSEKVNIIIFNIYAINFNGSWLWFIKSKQKWHNCRFSTSWSSHKSYFFSKWNLKIEIFK